MNDIHVAAGLPPGHSEAGCRCRPLMSQSLLDGGNIVIHRIAAPELLRPEQGGQSHADPQLPFGAELDPEQCKGHPDCEARAWLNGYCGPHQPNGPYVGSVVHTGTRVHGNREAETRRPYLEVTDEAICANVRCGHLAQVHGRLGCRFGGEAEAHTGHGCPCAGFAPGRGDAEADPGALPDPAPQHG